MKNYKEYATKRGIILNEEGPCQFCGAKVSKGVDECVEIFQNICGREFQDLTFGKVHLLTVDSHTLQHSEIHGKLNNNFHLIRICHMLENGGDTSVLNKSKFLSEIFKRKDDVPNLTPPDVLNRGSITVVDVYYAKNSNEHELKVIEWANSVWNSWSLHHKWARETLKQLG